MPSAPLGVPSLADRRVTLARAGEGTLPAIVALLADDVLGHTREGAPMAAYETAFHEIGADPRHLLLVVCDEADRVVGAMQLTIVPGLGRGAVRRMLIEAVPPGAGTRGHGLGAAVLEWAHGWGRSRGASLAQLTSDKQRTDAHCFTSRWGMPPPTRASSGRSEATGRPWRPATRATRATGRRWRAGDPCDGATLASWRPMRRGAVGELATHATRATGDPCDVVGTCASRPAGTDGILVDMDRGPSVIVAALVRGLTLAILAQAVAWVVGVLTGGHDANIGAGLIAFAATVVAAGAWGLLDGRGHSGRVGRVILRWILAGIVAAVLGVLAIQLPSLVTGRDGGFDADVLRSDLLTVAPFLAAIVAIPGAIGAIIGSALRTPGRATAPQ